MCAIALHASNLPQLLHELACCAMLQQCADCGNISKYLVHNERHAVPLCHQQLSGHVSMWCGQSSYNEASEKKEDERVALVHCLRLLWQNMLQNA